MGTLLEMANLPLPVLPAYPQHNTAQKDKDALSRDNLILSPS